MDTEKINMEEKRLHTNYKVSLTLFNDHFITRKAINLSDMTLVGYARDRITRKSCSGCDGGYESLHTVVQKFKTFAVSCSETHSFYKISAVFFHLRIWFLEISLENCTFSFCFINF